MRKTPHEVQSAPTEPPTAVDKFKRIVIGSPRNLADKRIFHHLSVVAFLAWVGLGSDGLSSSAYGPEEAFRTLGEHTYLALPIALVMICTVWIISACYSRIIDRFPHGGGGYVVATALLSPWAGVVSGSALLVDYVLTITVSIAAAGDAIFSLLPPAMAGLKLPSEAGMIVLLTLANIRGVKEPILALMPVFLVFLATHVVLIVGGLATHVADAPRVAREVHQHFSTGMSTLGLGGMLLLFLHAYSLGGGTYTGIEAVSNGLPIMREPRARTAKRTMIYMALSLSFMAAGLIVCYLLWDLRCEPNKTLNAILVERVSAGWPMARELVIVTLMAEGALLVVAAQAGFIDGPRVLANMAIDSWAPRRFAALSDRLTTGNGIVLMGSAALAAILYTRGDVRQIVVMYSINVFLTFSISMLAMSRMLLRKRKQRQAWRRPFILFATGLAFCATILAVTVIEKFSEGGWLTLVATTAVVLMCFAVRRHYQRLSVKLTQLYAGLDQIPSPCPPATAPVDATQPTAAILVGGYSGLGIHTLLATIHAFPNQFRNVVFLGAGVIDSGAFKGEDTVDLLRNQIEEGLKRYVAFARSHGLPASYRMTVGTDAVVELEQLCLQLTQEFQQVTFFAGQIIFRRERWYHRLLHNGTAYLLQKRLQLHDRTLVILPAKVT